MKHSLYRVAITSVSTICRVCNYYYNPHSYNPMIISRLLNFHRRCIILMLLAALMLGVLPLTAQKSDTLSIQRCDHSFQVGQLAMPGVFIAAGAAGFLNPVKEWKVAVRDQVREYSPDRIHADDYIQYVPGVMAVAGEWLGAESQHNFLDRLLVAGTSSVVTAVLVNGLKYTIVSPRPYIYDEVCLGTNPLMLTPRSSPMRFNSFPSGHTATAFMGAELVRLEYGADEPWIAVAAYALATGTGVMRVWNEQHWYTDVLVGVGLGMLSARIGWWMLPWVSNVADTVLGLDATHGQKIAAAPTMVNGQLGMAMCLSF